MKERKLADKLLEDFKRTLEKPISYKNLPKELKELIILSQKLKSKKTGNQILMEMRYGK